MSPALASASLKRIFLSIFFIAFFSTIGYTVDGYFSLERFDREYDRSKLHVLAQKFRFRADSIKRPLDEFSRSLILLQDGRFDEAIRSLRSAIKDWPEFLPAHFVLARAYELTDDQNAAARQYEAYLSLLRKMEAGKLSISSAILSVVGFDTPERYDEAYMLIAERLAKNGIEVSPERIGSIEERTSPIDVIFKNPTAVSILGRLIAIVAIIGIFTGGFFGGGLRDIFLIAALGAIFVFVFWFVFKMTGQGVWIALAYMTYPLIIAAVVGNKAYVKYHRHFRTPRPGYWICKKCGQENEKVFHTCKSCQTSRVK
ncbi:MAG: tetratricopeptide repeat protein [Candidatus Omnitrophota bacterium]